MPSTPISYNEYTTRAEITEAFLTTNEGKKIDFLGNMEGFTFFTSIYKPFIKAYVIFYDVVDFFRAFKIIGNETFTVSYFSKDAPTENYTLNFKLVSISPETLARRSTDNEKLYTLHLISEEFFTDKKNLISRKFTGTVDSIVSDIVTNNLESSKTLNTDSNSTTATYFCNYYNPTTVLNYIASNYKSVFFEDLDGFTFKQFDTLFAEDEIGTITFPKADSLLRSGYNSVLNYRFSRYFDLEETAFSGEFGQTLRNFDLENYKINEVSDTFLGATANNYSLGNSSLLPATLNSDKNRVKVDYNNLQGKSDTHFYRSLFKNHLLQANMNGTTIRKIGKLYRLNYYGFDNEREMHPLYGGLWMTTAVKHEIINSVYVQDVEFAKCTFNDAGVSDQILGESNK